MNNIFEFLEKEHLEYIEDANKAKMLFKKSVQMVEIEVFSFCNRKCWFCPNSYIDRLSRNIYMPEENYLKILNELKEINYRNMISYSRYNEPLADRIILKRINQAKCILPEAHLHTNTNGDYITADIIDELYEAGLNSLNIQVYLGKDELLSKEFFYEKVEKIKLKIDLPYNIITEKYNDWYEIEMMYKKLKIRIYARNFNFNGCNRGGLLDIGEKRYERISPCLSPFHHVYIDYNGNVVPCCNIRSDEGKHKKFVIRNIVEDNIFGIYANSELVKWRGNLFYFGEKMYPCNMCNFNTFDDLEGDIDAIRKIFSLRK